MKRRWSLKLKLRFRSFPFFSSLVIVFVRLVLRVSWISETLNKIRFVSGSVHLLPVQKESTWWMRFGNTDHPSLFLGCCNRYSWPCKSRHIYPRGLSRLYCWSNLHPRICSTCSTRSFRLSPESANETDCYNHRQKRQAVVNIRSVVSKPCKVKETESSPGTTNKSDEIDKIEVHIVTCQITTDKTTRAQVQTKIWDSVHALTPFQPIG